MTATTDTRPRNADLPLDTVHVHPLNARRELRRMDEMTASIRESGVLQDVVVAPKPDQLGEWWIIMGHRRHEGTRRAGLDTIPARIRWDLTTEVDILAAMAQENLQRDDYTLIEEGTLYEQLSMRGLSDAEIGRRTGVKAGTVTRRRQLLDLPEKTKDRIQARQLTLDQANVLLEFADDPAEVRTLERALESESSSGFSYEVARARQRREAATKRTRLVAELAASGIDVIDQSPEWGQRLRVIFDIPHQQDEPKVWQVDRGGITAHAESGCTARLVAWISPGGWVTVGCTDLTHRQTDEASEDEDFADIGAGPASARAEERRQREHAERERQRAEQAKRDAEWRAADAVRHEHLQGYITGARKLTAPMSAAVALHVARHVVVAELEPDLPLLARLMGRPELAGALEDARRGDRNWDAEEDAEQAIVAALAKLPGPRALLATLAAACENTLHAPASRWHPTALRHEAPESWRAWLRLVSGPLGYEWCDLEAAALDAADREAEQQAAAAKAARTEE